MFSLSSQLGSICSVLGRGQAIVSAFRVRTDPSPPQWMGSPRMDGICLHQRYFRKHVLEDMAFTGNLTAREG